MFKEIYTSVEHPCSGLLLFYSQALLRIAVSFKNIRKMVDWFICIVQKQLKLEGRPESILC